MGDTDASFVSCSWPCYILLNDAPIGFALERLGNSTHGWTDYTITDSLVLTSLTHATTVMVQVVQNHGS